MLVDDREREAVLGPGHRDRSGRVVEPELHAIERLVGLCAVRTRRGRVVGDARVHDLGRGARLVIGVHERGARKVFLQPPDAQNLFEPKAEALQPVPPTRRLSAAHASDAEPTS